ncbi:hypothetical protein EYF80_016590 [Liparis tanakae]|uniref:Uncharacterized protein n=1 Tax=Liparis tanakae TaxID=230148 RepID=A0A4Z2I707_9TELE|nr:hypothetical protein EYF80_016590 [Liparis tanakae]
MTEQLLDLSLLKVEESSSVLLGRCRSLLERRRTGLGLLAGWSLFMQAIAAVRKTPWMLFSDVKAEHSRNQSSRGDVRLEKEEAERSKEDTKR